MCESSGEFIFKDQHNFIAINMYYSKAVLITKQVDWKCPKSHRHFKQYPGTAPRGLFLFLMYEMWQKKVEDVDEISDWVFLRGINQS